MSSENLKGTKSQNKATSGRNNAGLLDQDFLIHSFRKISSNLPRRGWTALNFDKSGEPSKHGDPFLFYLSDETHEEIRQALAFKDANGLTLDTITQEDFRLPSIAASIVKWRQQLDRGIGFAIIDTGLSDLISEADFEIVGWSLCNYFGQVIRQGINHDRRLFTVSDKGSQNTDPTRIGASAKRSAKHSDNGCLEPRPPCYIGLFCYQASNYGGESTIISAQNVFQTFADERPNLLPLLFKTYHFRSPQAHVWPSRGPTIQKPILEFKDGELLIHYARVMINPGMEMAGLSLSDQEMEALDYLDEVLERPELNFRTLLKPGQLLILNNIAFLHGREEFTPGVQAGRSLKRYWMWRRHIGAGTDPALLDLAELQDPSLQEKE